MPGSQTSRTIKSIGPRVTTLEALFAAGHRLDDVPLVAQVVAERLSHARLVVDDEDGGCHVGTQRDGSHEGSKAKATRNSCTSMTFVRFVRFVSS